MLAASVLFALIIASLILAFEFNEEGEKESVFWDSIATLFNGWFPEFEDGSLGYLLFMSILAIVGVMFTSVLIGIITNVIENKIYSLKRGNSFVLEKEHIIVLGFYPGEFTLLRQLIFAAAGNPSCVVIGEDMEREEMEHNISENIDVPKNFRIVCRTVDITDSASLEKCSVETCKTIIVSPTDDMRTAKAVLAVARLLEMKGVSDIRINAILSKSKYQFPLSMVAADGIVTFQISRVLARMIAHSCTQTGLSQTFREVCNFIGSEFYLTHFQGIEGLKFEELMVRMDNAVPVGVFHDGKSILNPGPDYIFNASDRVIVFSEERDSAVLVDEPFENPPTVGTGMVESAKDVGTVIIGYNETLTIILQELPENVKGICLAGHKNGEQERDVLDKIARERNLSLNYFEGDLHDDHVLAKLVQRASHIVILNDYDMDPEESDLETIFLLLKVRDIRERYCLDFNITVEMQSERNQRLIGYGNYTDYLVSASMSSLILAQVSESPELIDVFEELLSKQGNKLYLKGAALMRMEGSYTVRDLRWIMLMRGCVLIGLLDKEKNSRYNLPLNEVVMLTGDDALIVIGVR